MIRKTKVVPPPWMAERDQKYVLRESLVEVPGRSEMRWRPSTRNSKVRK
jgi:hypothetical protein